MWCLCVTSGSSSLWVHRILSACGFGVLPFHKHFNIVWFCKSLFTYFVCTSQTLLLPTPHPKQLICWTDELGVCMCRCVHNSQNTTVWSKTAGYRDLVPQSLRLFIIVIIHQNMHRCNFLVKITTIYKGLSRNIDREVESQYYLWHSYNFISILSGDFPFWVTWLVAVHDLLCLNIGNLHLKKSEITRE